MTERHFFVAGAQRSGTTWALRLLDAHPDIAMARPFRPEPKVFLRDDGSTFDADSYRATYFAGPKAAQARRLGEKSTSYMESQNAAGRIHAAFPKADIVFLLRNPVERAISNVRFSHANARESEPLVSALLREIERPQTVMSASEAGTSMSPQAYLARGRYAGMLRPYADLFGRERLKIFLTEAIVGSAAGAAALYESLGVDPGFAPPMLTDRVNAAEDGGVADIPAELRLRLEDHFALHNARLAEEFGLELAAWSR